MRWRHKGRIHCFKGQNYRPYFHTDKALANNVHKDVYMFWYTMQDIRTCGGSCHPILGQSSHRSTVTNIYLNVMKSSSNTSPETGLTTFSTNIATVGTLEHL